MAILDPTAVPAPIGQGGFSANPKSVVSPRLFATNGAPQHDATDLTSKTPVITETYLCELFVPEQVQVNGIALFNNATVGNNVAAALYDNLGNLVGATALIAQVASIYQRLPFTIASNSSGTAIFPLTLLPGTYYVAVQLDGTTSRLVTWTVGNCGAGKLTGTTAGTFAASITVPTTFTASLGPVASLY